MTLETIIKKHKPLVTKFRNQQTVRDRLDFLLEHRDKFDLNVDFVDGYFEISAVVKLTLKELDLVDVDDYPEELACELIEVESVPDVFRKLGFDVYDHD